MASHAGNKIGNLILQVMLACQSEGSRFKITTPRGASEELYGEDEVDPLATSGDGEGKSTRRYSEKMKTEIEKTVPLHENMNHMSLHYAFIAGYLIFDEYLALFSWYGTLLLCMALGLSLSTVVDQGDEYIGYLVWAVSWIALLSFVPMLRFFNTYEIDWTLKAFCAFGAIVHLFFCLLFWLLALGADAGLTSSLIILDYFFYGPLFLYMLIEFSIWMDNDFKIERLDKGGNGEITTFEYILYLKAYPIVAGTYCDLFSVSLLLKH